MKNYGYDEEGYKTPLSDRHLWKRIFILTAPFKLHLLGAIALSFVITGATLILPYLIQTGVDSYMTSKILPVADRIAGISNISIIYGACIFAFFIAGFFQILLLEWVGQSIMHTIRQTLFKHVLGLDLSFFNEQQSGGIVTRLTNDIQNMHEMFTTVIVNVFNDLLRIVCILGILVYMNMKLGSMMGLFLPASLLITIFFSRIARAKFRAMRQGISQINTFLAETIAGTATIQMFGKQSKIFDHFFKINRTYQGFSLGQVKVFGAFMPLTEFLSSIAIAIILWYGGGEVVQNKLSIGELIAFLSYMRLFFQPLRELSQKYSIVQAAMASAERIFALLDTERKILDKKECISPLPKIKGDISFNKIGFGYNKNIQILKDIDLQIKAGETVAIVGTTGSGKTTLINLLLRFYEPQTGTIKIDGQLIDDYKTNDLRSFVGVILQDIILLQDTLLANIAMDTGRTREEVEVILADTGMTRFVKNLPEGLDTKIGQGGQDLSTGEKQLLSFARVLCRQPAIVILDEATAAIDTESENILEGALAKTFAGKTSIVIAHRLSTIRRADRIIVMSGGKIIEEGNHQTLIAKKSRYWQLISMDQENIMQNSK
ncbi:MAG: ABC transporter ATP-binding protein/permease [Desulfotalea sp.]